MFEFIAERPALDFVPTLAERGSTNDEQMRTPDDLVAWAAESGLVEDIGSVTKSQLEQTRVLREAIFGLISALIDRRAADPDHRDLVNRAAAQPRPSPHLDDQGHVHRTGGLTALLSALAADCLDLHDSPDRQHLRWCADGRCTRPFVDRSHGQRRRWCGMKGCGDRAKAAAYRQRQRAST